MLEILLLVAVVAVPVAIIIAMLSVARSFAALLAEQGLPPVLPRPPAN
jgi:hypothetical protein